MFEWKIEHPSMKNWAFYAGFERPWFFSQLTEDTKFMETVFRNRGYNLHHFTDIEEARVWLKQWGLTDLIRIENGFHFLWCKSAMMTIKSLLEFSLLIPPN